MRVATFRDLKKMEVHEKPKPTASDGDVVVKVEYCGICGSDVHGYLNGVMVPLGAVMGHECSGVVAEVGKDVRDFRPGDRVVAKPIAQCGECAPCKRGAYSLCVSAFDRAIGITTTNDGAFAEYVKIEHPREMLFRLPDNVSFEQGALVEPLSTSLHAVRLSRVRPGDSVVVIGAGMIGLGTIQFLKLAGAGRIIALEISETKAGLALKAGADIVLDPLKEGEGLQAHILDLTDGVGAEVVYECSGVPFGFQNAMYFAKSGGQVMIVGIVDKEVAFTPFRMVLTEIEMKAVLGYYDEFDYVIRFLSQGRLNTDILISGIVPLSDVEKGFDRLLSSRDDVKILVRP
ncbi:MAG: alcohol dehydrogenase catalytic domain-containing protein [Syntrophorhabdales bacterium]|jgi:2-desacetyl-2-hydroxyethyl bacteriochlorophyllide A dehydrogenase